MAGDKILVVEDDPSLLDTLKYNLQKEGYSVITGIDGNEAIEIARREKPDLIILDIMLPDRLLPMTMKLIISMTRCIAS